MKKLLVNESDPRISRVFFALCKTVNTARSLAAWLCYKYDHTALRDLDFDPTSYGDPKLALVSRRTPDTFAYDLAVSEWLSKYKGLNLGVDRKAVAIQNFKHSEERMREVNAQLKKFSVTAQKPRLEAIISVARRKISQILGVRSQAEFDFGWGPGSTATIKGDVAWDKKILEKRISVTPAALKTASAVVGADIHWCRARGIDSEGPCSLLPCEFKVVFGNTITTVDKNASTDRTIAIEPTANIYIQKGIGSWIRRRLRSVCRINLDSQLVNQKFASYLRYATIDLKAASDSISAQLVRLLFPDEWVFLFELARSPCYKVGKDWHEYEKWSSMGNGYTFELETLVFYALAFAVQSIDSSQDPHAIVYGDDILVPVEHACATIEILNTFGFETNLKKTHYRGLYRESCGAHFFDGLLITPIYQKEVLNDVAETYHMANRLRHYASRLGGYCYSDSRIRPAWLASIDLANKFYLPYSSKYDGVDWTNDSLEGGYHFSLEDCEHFQKSVYAYGTRVNRLVFKPKKRKHDHGAALAYTLGSDAALNSDDVSLRGRGYHCTRRTRVQQSFRSNVWL